MPSAIDVALLVPSAAGIFIHFASFVAGFGLLRVMRAVLGADA